MTFESQLRRVREERLAPLVECWQRQQAGEEELVRRENITEQTYRDLEACARREVIPVLEIANRVICRRTGQIHLLRAEYTLQPWYKRLIHPITRRWTGYGIYQRGQPVYLTCPHLILRTWFRRVLHRLLYGALRPRLGRIARWAAPQPLPAVVTALAWNAWGDWPEIGQEEGFGQYGANALSVIVFERELIVRGGKPRAGGSYRALRPCTHISREPLDLSSTLQATLIHYLRTHREEWREHWGEEP